MINIFKISEELIMALREGLYSDNQSHCTTTTETAAEFDGGSGTATDPYIISTLEQLKSVSYYPKAYFKLNSDITGTLDNCLFSTINQFSGNFNGNHHTVTIGIQQETSYFPGMFGVITTEGAVYDLNLTGSITGSFEQVGIGSIAGFNAGKISGCNSNVTVNANGETIKNVSAGGIVGCNVSTGLVSDCYFSGTVSISGSKIRHAAAGGVVGFNNEGTIAGCSTASSITTEGTTMTYSAVGGMIGYNSGMVTNSKTSVTISASPVIAVSCVGGFIGCNLYVNTSNCVTGCSSSGKVTAGGDYTCAGGFIGYYINQYKAENVILQNCYSTCSVTVDANSTDCCVGGLVGHSEYINYLNCYAKGNLTLTGNSTSGGLIGHNKYASVINCYAKGTVSGSAYSIGGLIGRNISLNTEGSGSIITVNSLIDHCYATGNLTSPSVSYIGGLVGINTTDNNTVLAETTYGVTNSFTTGDITATGSSIAVAGGLLGFNQVVSVQYCYSSSDISATNMDDCAGLVAYCKTGTEIDNCYATGDITMDNSAIDKKGCSGGLVGYVYSGNIQFSYATGTASGQNSQVGGFIGSYSNLTSNNNYYNSDHNSKGDNNGSSYFTGLTTSQMTSSNAPLNMKLDFENVWYAMENDTDYRYYPQFYVFYNSSDSNIQNASIASAATPIE